MKTNFFHISGLFCGVLENSKWYLIPYRFERSKGGGLFSWLTSSDRVEEVEGYECKVCFLFQRFQDIKKRSDPLGDVFEAIVNLL